MDMNLDPGLAVMIAAVLGPTNLAINLLNLSTPRQGTGQKLVSGYLIALIFILLYGMYTGDLTTQMTHAPARLFSGYLLSGWAVLTGSVLLHEVHKRVERKKKAEAA